MLPFAVIPLPVCLLAIVAVGLVLGAVVNWAIYSLAWNPRDISPWSAPLQDAPPRKWADRIPVLGWFGLRREAILHGRRFWVRPMIVELAMGVGLAALFWWEVAQHGLIHGQAVALIDWFAQQPIMGAKFVIPDGIASAQFLGHGVLIVFMATATFIDIDEKIIPDTVTIPGTLLGLLLATMLPMTLLPHVGLRNNLPQGTEQILAEPAALLPADGAKLMVEPLTLAAPNQWPDALQGAPHWRSLILGLACYGLWCFALTLRIWRGSRGWWRGLAVITTRILRELRRPPLSWIGLLGAVYITAVWWHGGTAWVGLVSSLVGLVVSGGIVWAVRIVGTAALRREAMGFGDVTLMMMIGTYLGWQAGLIIFFVSPFAGLIVGVVQLVLRRDDVIPYGPFLCLGSLMVIVYWSSLWNPQSLQPIFGVPWLVALIMVLGMLLLGVMLAVWRVIKTMLFGGRF